MPEPTIPDEARKRAAEALADVYGLPGHPDHERAARAALAAAVPLCIAADRGALARVERKLDTLRRIAKATQSSAGDMLKELNNIDRAIAALRSSVAAQTDEERGCSLWYLGEASYERAHTESRTETGEA